MAISDIVLVVFRSVVSGRSDRRVAVEAPLGQGVDLGDGCADLGEVQGSEDIVGYGGIVDDLSCIGAEDGYLEVSA